MRSMMTFSSNCAFNASRFGRRRAVCMTNGAEGGGGTSPNEQITYKASEDVLGVARAMQKEGRKLHDVSRRAMKSVGNGAWESDMEAKHPLPYALFAHLDIMLHILASMILLCMHRGHIQASVILFRALLENFSRGRWIAHPNDIEDRVCRARASIAYRKKQERAIQGEKVAVQAEMEKEFGNDNAYGVIGFRRLLKSMGEEESYVMYQYASAIAHGTGQSHPADISLILCEATYNYSILAIEVWKVFQEEGFLKEEFLYGFAEASLAMLSVRENTAKKLNMSRSAR